MSTKYRIDCDCHEQVLLHLQRVYFFVLMVTELRHFLFLVLQQSRLCLGGGGTHVADDGSMDCMKGLLSRTESVYIH